MRRIFIPPLIFVYLVLISLLCFSKGPAKGEDKKAENAKEGYTGVEVCQTCHAQVYEQLTKTPMGTLFLNHPRTPAEKLGCETCHGPGTDHANSGGKALESIVRFTKGSPTPLSVRNDACLKCHQKSERLFWEGSAHETNDLACTSCHVVHTGPGITARAQLANITVEDTCLTCHKEQARAEQRFSHHPLREGKMDCASCHNPHGTTSPKLVKGFSNKELCLNCHAQYRGPFVFQHPPVMEDCFNCHQPHGSAYPSLLKAPPIRLCRECHITFHNVSFQPGGNGSQRPNMMVGAGCLNCHRNIHGSNNVNGNDFFR